MQDLLWQSAHTQQELIRRGEISAVELMAACYDRIEAVNPAVNALVSLLPRESALELARAADDAQRRGVAAGPLHGLPMAPKDLQDARGFPTTFGFVPWANQIASHDSALVARQRGAGAIMIGKSNVPEFGLGSHTFNSLFGTTRNPYSPDRSAGGSSGGAAVALACGMLSIADGSDMGGSLRNPAAFCNVVGFRPSIGRVPDERGFGWLARLSTGGPMARDVNDVALLLSVQAGPWSRDPLTRSEPGDMFDAPLEIDLEDRRVAVSEDLGWLPVETAVRSVVRQAGTAFSDLGASVETACPDLRDAMDVFQVQRAANLAVTGRLLERTVPDWRTHAKDTAVWNIERGFELNADDLIDAELKRTNIYRRVVDFFDRFDVLVLPSAQVTPFPAAAPWVSDIEGHPMATYLDWMTVCCAISVTGLPAISVPGGFTSDGLPVGVQIVGPPGGDLKVLRFARAFEAATGHGRCHPDLGSLSGLAASTAERAAQPESGPRQIPDRDR